jgi:apolipoprotein N-acyltransferase
MHISEVVLVCARKQTAKDGFTRGCAQFAGVALSLVLSALVMAAALQSSSVSWLAWVGLLPLFLAVRIFGPLRAALAGAIWGACLYGFASSGPDPSIAPQLPAFVLLVYLLGVYAACASLVTRAIGFNPIVLAIGWILLESGLKPLNLHYGLLASTQTDGLLHAWFGRALGYVFVAFLVAYANASLLAFLTHARWGVLPRQVLTRLVEVEVRRITEAIRRVQKIAIPQAHPRAPPA